MLVYQSMDDTISLIPSHRLNKFKLDLDFLLLFNFQRFLQMIKKKKFDNKKKLCVHCTGDSSSGLH